MTGRIIAAVLMLSLVVAAGVFLTSDPEGSDPSKKVDARWKSSRQCAECHDEIADEVNRSWHGQSFTDPDVRELSSDFQDETCLSCHAPAPVYEVGPGERVFERHDFREEGVNCISCHLLPDGRVAAARNIQRETEPPCRPVYTPSLTSAQFCAGCHNQHGTVDEYLASPWAKTDSCNDCHMPKVDRPLARGGPVREKASTHLFEGGHFLWMLKDAMTLDAEVDGDTLIARVTNSGAGHKAPTDARHRSFNLVVSIRDHQGNLLVDQQELAEYRLYYRDMHKEPTQIDPLETKVHPFDLPQVQGGGVAIVELYFCLSPPDKLDGNWTLVWKVERPF